MHYSLLRFAWMGAVILGLASSCTTTVHLEALAPASVPMPPTLQRIATANRILPDSRRDKFFDVLEGIFTGEGPMVDRAGAEACVLSTGEALMRNSPRFRVTPANLQLVGRTREFFLPPMSPDYVRRVCRTSQVDGLVVLEAFDSDMQLQRRQEERVIKEKDKPDRKVMVTVVHMDMRIVSGFRTYGPEGLVVDQARQEDHMGWTSEGATYQAALAGLPAPERCIREVALRIGDQYARRIAPSYVPLTRNVYTRAKKNAAMEQARQCVQATDWTQAAARWQQAARSLNHVVAGRAFYNLAVYEEMNNHLPEAIDYARKAAYTCQMRPAIAYLRVLQDRQQAEQLVQTQMAGSRGK